MYVHVSPIHILINPSQIPQSSSRLLQSSRDCFYLNTRHKMLLKTASSSSSSVFSIVNFNGVKKDSIAVDFFSNLLRVSSGNFKNNLSVSVRASEKSTADALSGVVFEPFVEVKKELDLVPTSSNVSLARQKYPDECEAAINEQINVEYNVSYVYHAMYAYFDRDNIALKGLAKFFKESSVEEREHAEKLMEYQNKRGGRVNLQSIAMPLSEFEHVDKGDALYGMELALSLEKLVNEKLLNLHSIASRNEDVQLADFIESEFLNEQVEAIKKISEYVAINYEELAKDTERGISIRCFWNSRLFRAFERYKILY